MRDYDDYSSGVLANEKRNRDSSEIATRDEFNRQHPPTTGLVVPDDLLSPEEGLELMRVAAESEQQG